MYTSLKPEEYEEAAEKVGIASIKYYDLKQNRISAYAFNYDKMLDPRGNTAVYLLYAYVRMCSIIRKAGTILDYSRLHSGEHQRAAQNYALQDHTQGRARLGCAAD